MCIGSSPSTPTPPPLPPEPAPPPTPVDPEVREARRRTRSQAALAEGRQGTILSSPLGVTRRASTATKSLLGE